MIQSSESAPARPFFLKTRLGERFCLFYPPAGEDCRGGVIYVPPFGDEMNKARRMAALQARMLASLGFGVLQMDLFGCGDSSGDFGEARWDIWKDDLAQGHEWLQDQVDKPVSLWGLRLGGLLALDYAKNAKYAIDRILLWQPVLNGSGFLTQLLRLRIARDMLGDDKDNSAGTQAMRESLRAGESLEIGGYEIAPDMAAAIDALNATDLAAATCPVHWFEIISAAGRGITPAGMRVVNAWKQRGVDLHVHAVQGLPFWATQEIAECPELLTATSAIFPERSSISRMASHEH
jgi:exosortase A-associated hydrolase 2